jgi:hypothetical protein
MVSWFGSGLSERSLLSIRIELGRVSDGPVSFNDRRKAIDRSPIQADHEA